jgi:hypothetical protein
MDFNLYICLDTSFDSDGSNDYALPPDASQVQFSVANGPKFWLYNSPGERYKLIGQTSGGGGGEVKKRAEIFPNIIFIFISIIKSFSKFILLP